MKYTPLPQGKIPSAIENCDMLKTLPPDLFLHPSCTGHPDVGTRSGHTTGHLKRGDPFSAGSVHSEGLGPLQGGWSEGGEGRGREGEMKLLLVT